MAIQPLLAVSLVLAAWVAAVAGQSLSSCDPIDPSTCLSPFPNNFFLRTNATTKRPYLFFNHSFPHDGSGKYVNEQAGGWNDLDGFSCLMPITVYMGEVSLDNVPHYWQMTGSTTATSVSILIDAVSGERVAHFVEADISAGAAATVRKMLVMWPAQRLKDERRYIVAYRNLVNKTSGSPVLPSYGFSALRDRIQTTDPDIELRRALFEDIFSILAKAGVARDATLQVAWDFTTGSRQSITSKMVFMRDDAFSRVAASGGIRFAIRSVKDNVSDHIIRQVEGTVWVPNYMSSHFPGSHLILDNNGRPVYQDLFEAPFTLLIPRVLVKNGTVGSILQYGHGLFGDRSEVTSGYLGDQANDHGYVLAATNWIGLSEIDAPVVTLMLASDLTDFRMVPDRCQQGMLNALFLMRLLREGKIAKDPSLIINGKPVLDSSSQSYYYGNSQGGILGSVYMALSQDVKRGVLGVGGGPYSLMLPRSHDFSALFELIAIRYPPTLDRFILFSVMQLLWDRADPGGYMSAITSNPLPNTPTHEVILQHGLGDAQVSYIAVYTLGRSVGASMFQSNVHEPGEELFGFPFIKDTDVGRTAMEVTWQFAGTKPSPQTDIPPSKDGDTHEKPRRTKAAQDMMYRFFTTGDIINTCGGECH